jgi:hypothetical protein
MLNEPTTEYKLIAATETGKLLISNIESLKLERDQLRLEMMDALTKLARERDELKVDHALIAQLKIDLEAMTSDRDRLLKQLEPVAPEEVKKQRKPRQPKG